MITGERATRSTGGDRPLTADDLEELQGGAAEITAQGERYPEHAQRMIDR